jgi:hypothetical protein
VANTRATEFELVNNSLGGPVPEFELDGRIQYKLGCNHPSQLFWQCHCHSEDKRVEEALMEPMGSSKLTG